MRLYAGPRLRLKFGNFEDLHQFQNVPSAPADQHLDASLVRGVIVLGAACPKADSLPTMIAAGALNGGGVRLAGANWP
jgi:hypothetical protein